jgi:hypothetical protein
MYAGEQLADENGKQVALFPLTRFFNKSTLVAEHFHIKEGRHITEPTVNVEMETEI